VSTCSPCCGARRMSSVTQHLRPSPSVWGARYLPCHSVAASAIDPGTRLCSAHPATGSAEQRGRCHSRRIASSATGSAPIAPHAGGIWKWYHIFRKPSSITY